MFSLAGLDFHVARQGNSVWLDFFLVVYLEMELGVGAWRVLLSGVSGNNLSIEGLRHSANSV